MSNKIANEKIKDLNEKDRRLWETIRRRYVFREFRWLLRNLDIHVYIPFNSAEWTDEYCKKYGNSTFEMFQEDPNEEK